MRKRPAGNAYYFSNQGNDDNKGSLESPFSTLAKISSLLLLPGDTIYLLAGQVFNGSIFVDSTTTGNNRSDIVITSYGNGRAEIYSDSLRALTLHKTAFISIRNLNFRGAGRKTGNSTDGIVVNESSEVTIDSVQVTGFQKAGLLIYNSHFATVTNLYASENGSSGIYVLGASGKKDCTNILISHCVAENNPGDPTNLTNHSGNGIVAGNCTKVNIQYAVATNNGWDMPRKGNGPVGIWCYEADSVVIEHCISYRNKTAPGGGDGGGFDLDGGVTNSIIQYCLSYENQGAGFGIFQYAGASNWHNNSIRYCISENDGNTAPDAAGVFIWNSSDDTTQFRNGYFYNNVVYNTYGPAISYEQQSKHAGFYFINNIFVGADEVIHGWEDGSHFLYNNWFSLKKGVINQDSNFLSRGIEKKNGNISIHPNFNRTANAMIEKTEELSQFFNYQIPENSLLRNRGMDITEIGLNAGSKTFNQQPAPLKGIGACF